MYLTVFNFTFIN